jgi:tetratricopeptide (TPR) repeat protein
MAMSEMTVKEKKQYEESIVTLYERVAESDNNELRDSALFMLASKRIGNAQYDKAQQIIDKLPNHNVMDKRSLQALLWTKEGKPDKALEGYERMLLMSSTNVWNYMLSLINIEIEEKKIERVTKIAIICSEYAKLLELPDYYVMIPLLLETAAKQNVEETLAIIEKLLSCCNVKWSFSDLALFKDIPCKGETLETIPILPGILTELNSNPLFSFIQENDRFRRLNSTL